MAKISQQNFIRGIEDEYVHQSVQSTDEVQTLQKEQQPREDYRELVIIFLGRTPRKRIYFRFAFYHHRWMAKSILTYLG